MKKILLIILLSLSMTTVFAIDRKIIDYMVIGSDSPIVNHLTQKVRDAMKSGWQPFGNICTVRGSTFFQPMVKYEE